MDGERRLRGLILTITLGCLMTGITTGCNNESLDLKEEAEIHISLSQSSIISKAMIPDEDRISNVNLWVFDDNGCLEKSVYLDNGSSEIKLNLLKGARYSIFACVNFGYRLDVSRIGNLKDLTFHLAYPDEYKEGIPMYGALKDYVISKDEELDIQLTRLISKISLRMDRRKLSKDVKIMVNSIRIGNCPRKSKVFTPNTITQSSDCFRVGFRHEDIECAPLNSQASNGLSNYISVYMMENLQGKFSEDGIGEDQEKVFEEYDPRSGICSYIEIEMDYFSGEMVSTEKPLIYRFYLGEDRNSLDIYRNCHYRITICPEDDGLNGEGWRIDKSGLDYVGPVNIEQYPSDYIVGDIGDVIHIGCRLTPEWTEFDIGEEYLADDKMEGIYDYEIDPDGHGVILTLTGEGRGLIYMTAGEPINDSALFIIEVNQPK